MQSKTIIDLLSNERGRQFIGEHLKDNVKELALNAAKYPDINIRTASALILLYQKAELKLPEHYKLRTALNQKSYEQSTSEAVAKFKAGIMDIKGKHVVNITGGIGVDDWAMSEYASGIDSCDIDKDIHELATFNLGLFKNNKVRRHWVDGINYIKSIDKTDVIYADPDRRANSVKAFRLEDCQPEIVSNMELLLTKAKSVWLKISPMADITYLRKCLSDIVKIYVIALLGEVKEILICCSRHLAKGIDDPELIAVNIGKYRVQQYLKRRSLEKPLLESNGKYLYEPGKAIIKADLSQDYCSFIEAGMLGVNSHLFVSDRLIQNFQGRSFEVVERMAYKPKIIKAYLDKEVIKKANITTRNFRETPAELRGRFKLKDGGDVYLFFTTDSDKNAWVFVCKPISDI